MVVLSRHKKPFPEPMPIEPASLVGSMLSRLKSNVRTLRPISPYPPYDIPWSNVVRYAEIIERNAAREGLDPLDIAAMCMIESDSNQFRENGSLVSRDDGFGDGLSIGIMQVKPQVHQWRDPNANPATVEGNIRLGSLVLSDGVRRFGSFEAGLLNIFFPTDDPNGTSQGSYIKAERSLKAEIRNQTQPQPAPEPNPQPVPKESKEPLQVIFGGHSVHVEYGFRDDVGLNYYSYGVNHGTTAATQHTGDDCLVPDETPLYSPGSGIVTCVGWKGNVTWGQGCGYYEDQMGGGIGNISILLDSKRKIVLGHSSSAVVNVGQRVKAGELVGKSGGMNGPHTHLECAIQGKNGEYWLMDPQPELRKAMKGEDILPPEIFEDRFYEIPAPNEFDRYATVIAKKGGIPVLQRAWAGAPPVRKPLEAGEDFEASYQAMGADGHIYWITRNWARVPVIGTESEDWPVG